MQVLFSAAAVGVDLAALPKDIHEEALHIFNNISVEFNSMADDNETYLCEDWSQSRFLLGKNEPKKLLEQVRSWNRDIEKEFLEATDALLQVSKTGKLPEHVTMDDLVSYRMRKAVCELDNHWTAFGEHTVYVENDNNYAYFSVLVKDNVLADIEEHPENYGIVEVFPK